MAVILYIIFVLVMGFVFASVSSSMARRRNRESGLWGLFGFFAGLIGGFIFGFIPVILLAILGNNSGTAPLQNQNFGNNAGPTTTPVASIGDRYKEIEALSKLLEQKIITEEEFDREKKKLLA